jgi:CheY-like chemotaxis protein
MIVDDSKLARMAVVRALGSLQPDWRRVEAANAEEALALARTSAIDMTVLDYNMPGQDGLSLAAALRDLHPAMPVAIITANLQTEIITRAKEIGATFLPKPLTESAFKDFLDGAARRLKAASR